MVPCDYGSTLSRIMLGNGCQDVGGRVARLVRGCVPRFFNTSRTSLSVTANRRSSSCLANGQEQRSWERFLRCKLSSFPILDLRFWRKEVTSPDSAVLPRLRHHFVAIFIPLTTNNGSSYPPRNPSFCSFNITSPTSSHPPLAQK